MSDKQRQVGSRTEQAAEAGELKFLQVDTGDESGGGWYRELDETQIEVLTRASLERVAVETSADAESTARGKIAEIISRPRVSWSDKAH